MRHAEPGPPADGLLAEGGGASGSVGAAADGRMSGLSSRELTVGTYVVMNRRLK